MKQRFSSLDVKVIARELSQALVTLRLSNVYDLSSKILLLKFAKPNDKKQMVIDSGFRCHLTNFARTTAGVPSAFASRLRKFLKTRRVTSVSQIGTDRIIEFQFSDGQYRLYLEFFASGNVILTDADLKILTLMRNVPEGEGQEPQRVGLTYSLENRQNYGGLPDLTKERVRNSLQSITQRAAAAETAGKKIKKKAGDDLRRGLATTLTELPPILVDHAFYVAKFDATVKPASLLADEDLFESLFKALTEARSIVDGIGKGDTNVGYVIGRKKPNTEGDTPGDMMFEDFQPFLPRKIEEDDTWTTIKYDSFNEAVDMFFYSIEGMILESRLNEREAAAQRKLDAARQLHAQRLEGLQEAQMLNLRKAAAIEANVERVQEAMDAITGLLNRGMDWVDIGKLIEREQKRQNSVAEIIKLPLKLADHVITLLISEEEPTAEEDEDEGYDTDSTVSEDDEAAADTTGKKGDQRLEVDIKLDLSPFSNAREYYDQKRSAAEKEQKTLQQSATALKNTEQKIAGDLKKGLKQEKAVLQPIRRQLWFEKFLWFISSDGYLVLGGRDAQQNEMLYKRYLRKGDVYVHADLHGAATVIIKNNPKTPDAPIPPSTLSQAGQLAVCSSNAWDSKAGMGAWWVPADQVSKSAPTGEYLPTGSFMVRGKKNFLSPAQLLLGFGIIFKISEESKARHVKHRLHDAAISSATDDTPPTLDHSEKVQDMQRTQDEVASDSDDGQNEQEDTSARDNPLLTDNRRDSLSADENDDTQGVPSREVASLDLDGEPQTIDPLQPSQNDDVNVDQKVVEEEEENDETTVSEQPTPSNSTAPASIAGTTASQKKGQPKRGQRGKAKKIAAKYKDQDDEDRAAIEALIGTSAGKQKAEAEAKAKAQREAEMEATRERRRAQHQRQQKETAEHEEIRRMMLDEGVEMLDDAELEKATPLDTLVGTPLAGDEILEAIPICAPWTAMAKCKYKAKMQPGAQKKGKAVKEIIDRWRVDSGKKGSVDESAKDSERMWPREVELIKGLKPEEAINCVPVGKVKVMMSGGSGGGGGGSSKGGNQGKGGRGGKGSKRK